jgi:hypothetical protein
MFGGTGALLGHDKHGKAISLKQPELSTHVIGAHGTGKSTLLLNLMLSDIKRRDKAVVLLDPHGELVSDLLSRIDPADAHRVIYFAPAEQQERPFALNPFEWSRPKEYQLKFEAITSIFLHLWYGNFEGAPTMQNTLETLARTLLTAYPQYKTHFMHMLYALASGPLGDEWRAKLAPCVAHNPALALKWEEWGNDKKREADSASSRKKIDHIVQDEIVQPIICQSHSSACFRFEESLGAKKILLCNLVGMNEESQKLIGSIILTQIVVMAFLRAEIPDRARVPCHLYADEFHRFAPGGFIKLINECRKYGVFCTMAHQNQTQLTPELRAAVDAARNTIVFRVHPADANTLKRQFKIDDSFPEHGLGHLDDYNAMVLLGRKKGEPPVQARIKTRKQQGKPNEAVAQAIREQSIRQYGRKPPVYKPNFTDVGVGAQTQYEEPSVPPPPPPPPEPEREPERPSFKQPKRKKTATSPETG